MINKRKKSSRTRGHKTHGYGSMKKNRGAGNRGGRGNAGSGKRGDAKKPSYWKNKKYMGKHGFKYHGTSEDPKTINISTVEKILPDLIERKLALKTNKGFEVDLGKLGYTKLLGKGKPYNKLIIKIDKASEKCIVKVKSAGGDVVTLDKNEPSE